MAHSGQYGTRNWQPPYRTVTWRVKNTIGKLLVGTFVAAVFGFIALVLLWPFIFGGTILYVLLHFIRKVW